MALKQKPSNKVHRRYLLIVEGTKKEIEETVLDYVGILGWAKCKPVFVEDKRIKKGIVLSIERKSLEDIRASFELSNKNMKIVKVSGTIEGLSK
ncbi:MAG: hypothetical protein AABW80_04430 [Nanoarchaeota archaeon]